MKVEYLPLFLHIRWLRKASFRASSRHRLQERASEEIKMDRERLYLCSESWKRCWSEPLRILKTQTFWIQSWFPRLGREVGGFSDNAGLFRIRLRRSPSPVAAHCDDLSTAAVYGLQRSYFLTMFSPNDFILLRTILKRISLELKTSSNSLNYVIPFSKLCHSIAQVVLYSQNNSPNMKGWDRKLSYLDNRENVKLTAQLSGHMEMNQSNMSSQYTTLFSPKVGIG